jgi:hypothetical protein
MSLEKSIQKLTQVIQAAQLGRQEPTQNIKRRERDMPYDEIEDLPKNRFGQSGNNCYWALRHLEADPREMEGCCTDARTELPVCYYRNEPGGEIFVRH